MLEPSPRSLRSLQGRYEVIKQSCSRWSGCLEEVRNAPPSGCTTDDYDRIAQERYKQMAASKGKTFVLQHCWKLLEHSEKWNLRNKEVPPQNKSISNSPSIDLEDNEDEDEDENEDEDGNGNGDDDDDEDEYDDCDEATPPRNKGRPDRKRKAEAVNVIEMIVELMKSSHAMKAQALQVKIELDNKKLEYKMTMWQQIRDIEKRKLDLEERRLLLKENKMRQEIKAKENQLMMMDPGEMGDKAREC
uniref:Uncharacterized protein n=2 Tax=Avena sativa TaxID=4498 RepID=A0ACD5WU55_AVESA